VRFLLLHHSNKALAVLDGPIGSKGEGILSGVSWGLNPETRVSPRLVVMDPLVEPIGRYSRDNAISAARKETGKHTSIFIGDICVNTGLLRELFCQSGDRLWAKAGTVVRTDGGILFTHRPLGSSFESLTK